MNTTIIDVNELQILASNALYPLNKKYVETELITMFDASQHYINDLTSIMEILQAHEIFLSKSLKEILTNVLLLKKFTSSGNSKQFFYENLELLSVLYDFGVSVYSIIPDRFYLTSVCFNLNKEKKMLLYLSNSGKVLELVNHNNNESISIANCIIDQLLNDFSVIIQENQEKKDSDFFDRFHSLSHTSTESKILVSHQLMSSPSSKRNTTKHITANILPKLQAFNENKSRVPFSTFTKITEYPDQTERFGNVRYMTAVPNTSLENPAKKFHGPYTYIPHQSEKKDTKAIILAESKVFHYGVIKYFDEKKEFGFITPDINDEFSELFFHYHDVLDDKLGKEVLALSKLGIVMKVQFKIMDYVGKYQNSKKAVQISLTNDAKRNLKI